MYLLAVPLHAEDKSAVGGVVLACDTAFYSCRGPPRVEPGIYPHRDPGIGNPGITLLIVRWSMARPYRPYSPVFRATDWEHYINVNRKFADALMEEINDEQHPVVLIQDYHFASVMSTDPPFVHSL
jgi:hypothetical protein